MEVTGGWRRSAKWGISHQIVLGLWNWGELDGRAYNKHKRKINPCRSLVGKPQKTDTWTNKMTK